MAAALRRSGAKAVFGSVLTHEGLLLLSTPRGCQRDAAPAKFRRAFRKRFANTNNLVRAACTPYHLLVQRRSRGPGLRKTTALPVVRRRSVELWQSTDYHWRQLFESADVMSEGATRSEPDGPVYYGSTSLLLTVASQGGLVPDDDLERLLALLPYDPHARLRAVRVACLEAQLRSGGSLGRVRAEVSVKRDPRGARVDIDVEADVHALGAVTSG